MTTATGTAFTGSAVPRDDAVHFVEDASEHLLGLSHRIHDLAEIGFEEHSSVGAITELLESFGHHAAVGGHDLPTSFRANAGTDGPVVALLAEYDALQGVGHGCGHNIIASAAVGGFLGAASVVERSGGRVALIGTPAEENGGGKELLARAGAFDDIDAVLMVHPMAAGHDVARFESLGARSVKVTFHGESSHASAAPELGRNALDATVAGYQGMAALRQHMPTQDRLHGIITEGGDAPNIVPDKSSSVWILRSATPEGLQTLSEKARAIFEGAALMTGTTVEFVWDLGPAYLPVRSNEALAARYAEHIRARGRVLADDLHDPIPLGGSTDLGNISLRMPAIHPTLAIAPPSVPMHSAQFAGHANSAEGDRAVIDAAVALAATAVDFLSDPALREHARSSFIDAGGPVDVEHVLRVPEGVTS